MRIQTLITSFVLATLFFSNQLVLLPGQALALPWCGCGRCYLAQTGVCTCKSPYYYCADDSDAAGFPRLIDSQPIQTSVILEGFVPAQINSESNETVTRLLSRGTCLHGQSRLTLLSQARRNVTIMPIRIESHPRHLMPSLFRLN